MNTTYLIDFDSTFVKIEALDTLSEIALADHPQQQSIVAQIKQITDQGMEGKITFTQSLKQRLALFAPTRNHIQSLINTLQNSITDSVITNRQWFQDHASNIYIISGGFAEYILPIVAPFGITADHVLANEFIFQNESAIGFDTQNFLSQPQGKVKAVESLGLAGTVIVIGDGYTDYEIKQLGQADAFYAFTENISRSSVTDHADKIINSFDQIALTQ